MPRLPVVPDVGTYVREQRVAAQLSLRQLAQRAGMSNPYLSQIERGLRKPSAEILSALADALDLSAETLYVRAGILDDVPRDTTVVAAIGADPHLSEAQKRSLTDLYRLFVGTPEHDLLDAAHAPAPSVAPDDVDDVDDVDGGARAADAEDESGAHDEAGGVEAAPTNVIALPTAGPDPTEPHQHHPEETP